jgi:carbamate kinase
MRIVAALGGNALLQRGQPLTAGNQRANARIACRALARIAEEHELVISHGNGPQVGLLALQASAYTEVEPYPLDLLGAQTEGMIGYLIQQELGNELRADKPIASLLTMIEIDATDPAFDDPTKPIGPLYGKERSDRLAKDKDWVFKRDGNGYRRVVSSPTPQRIYGLEPLEMLLEHGCVVTCAGGGGIPVTHTDEPVPAGTRLVGVEAVIDKDLASALLACDLHADALLIITDVDAVYSGWGTPGQRAIRRADPATLSSSEFAEGSMGPKVRAACTFVEETGGFAAIGSITDIDAILRGEAGTVVARDAAGLELVGAA